METDLEIMEEELYKQTKDKKFEFYLNSSLNKLETIRETDNEDTINASLTSKS